MTAENDGSDSRGHDDERLEGMVLEDRYRVERRIGSGGMGSVYLAEQLALRVPVVVKVLHRDRAEDFTCIYRFFREARVAARVLHPNVARVLDIGRAPDGRVFLVMEYLRGEDLSQILARDGALPWPRARRILRGVARGLRAAHAIGVIHRDVKPSNVFVVAASEAGAEQVKLLDFGIAKAGDPSRTFGERLTCDGLVGTVDYIAPECVLGDPASVRSDVYALGVMMFEVLTGCVPWSHDGGPVRAMMRRVNEEPPSLPELLPGVPAGVAEIVRRAMARDPAERFATVAELEAAMRDFPAREPSARRSVFVPQPAPPSRPAAQPKLPHSWVHTLRWSGEPPEKC